MITWNAKASKNRTLVSFQAMFQGHRFGRKKCILYPYFMCSFITQHEVFRDSRYEIFRMWLVTSLIATTGLNYALKPRLQTDWFLARAWLSMVTHRSLLTNSLCFLMPLPCFQNFRLTNITRSIIFLWSLDWSVLH